MGPSARLVSRGHTETAARSVKMGNVLGMKGIMEENMKKQMDFQTKNMELQVRVGLPRSRLSRSH